MRTRWIRNLQRYSRLLGVIGLSAAIILCNGCEGVGGGSEPATARQVNAFRSLRLGQTDSPNSPVATTAAANNGEAVILLNRTPGSTELVHALFVTANRDVVRITIGPDGRPQSAQTADTQIAFSSFTEDSVQVSFTNASGTFGPVETALPDDVSKLLDASADTLSTARALESEEVLQALFRAAIIAIRTFGCSGGSAARQLGITGAFLNVADSACSSLLVQLLSALIAEGDFAARAVFGLSEISSCDFSIPGWVDDFNNASTCALGLADQLLQTVRTLFPPLEIALADPTPTPAPTPTPPPTQQPDNDDDDDDPAPRNCQLGQFRCDNGRRICREQICDGRSECSDDSDESSSTCTPQVICCIVSGGCPGESSGSCAPTCCCCGSGQQCDVDTYGGGCESAPLRNAPSEPFSTFRKWFDASSLTYSQREP